MSCPRAREWGRREGSPPRRQSRTEGETMIIIGYDGSPDARAGIKQAGMLMSGDPALVLTVWGPPGPEGLPEAETVRNPAQARAVQLASDGAWLGHQLGID